MRGKQGEGRPLTVATILLGVQVVGCARVAPQFPRALLQQLLLLPAAHAWTSGRRPSFAIAPARLRHSVVLPLPGGPTRMTPMRWSHARASCSAFATWRRCLRGEVQ